MANSNSSSVFPTPEKIISLAFIFAASARCSSPPETISAPEPALPSKYKIAIDEFALTAK